MAKCGARGNDGSERRERGLEARKGHGADGGHNPYPGEEHGDRRPLNTCARFLDVQKFTLIAEINGS